MVERSTDARDIVGTSLEANLQVDRGLLTLVLASGKSKRSTIVVDLLLNKECSAVDGDTESTSCGNSSSGCRGCCCGSCDGYSRDHSSSARHGGSGDDGRDGDELSNCVCDGGADEGQGGSLSARALVDDSGTGNDCDSATDGQSLATVSDECSGVDKVGIDDGGCSTSNSSASVSACIAASIAASVSASSCATIASVGTRSECSRESDNRSRSDNSSSGDTRTVGENRRSGDHSRNSSNRDSLTAVDSHRRWVDKLSDLGDSRQSGDIASRIGGCRRSYGVTSSVKVDRLWGWASLSD